MTSAGYRRSSLIRPTGIPRIESYSASETARHPTARLALLPIVKELRMLRNSQHVWNGLCSELDRSHKRLIQLLKKSRAIASIKKVFVRSGIRYDLAMDSPEYVKELCDHHVSGLLKIAPEHVSPHVLYHTGKDPVTRENVYVPRTCAEKKAQKKMLS